LKGELATGEIPRRPVVEGLATHLKPLQRLGVHVFRPLAALLK